MKKSRFYAALIIALCMIISFAMLTSCGSDSNGASDSAEPAASEEEEEQEPADPKEKFCGSWSLAAAESNGVTMAGNFKELAEMDDLGMLNINEDGTGEMAVGKKEADKTTLTWELKDDDTITLKPAETTESLGESVDVRYENEALLMEIEQDDQTGTAIFTHDGTYPEARIITMEDAVDITSEDELIGKWTMTAMNLMGISVYGSSEDLSEMSGGNEIYIEFKKDGAAEMSGSEGSWKVDGNGAVLTATDISGTNDYPVKKLEDEIVVDMSASLNGTTFIAVLSK
ncbi:MAG: hypothetical protein IJH92_08170 [Mogibacterium sp.]|nr:hypothetical protein [Mogibacterium sp.]